MKFSIILLASLALLSLVNSAPQPQDEDEDDFFEESSEEIIPEPKIEPKAVPVLNAPAAAHHEHPQEQQQQQQQQQQPSHGSNYARYNQSCSDTGLHCNPNKNMVCESEFCKCRQSIGQQESFYTYSRFEDNCFPVSREEDNWSCQVDEQCSGGKLGAFSRCNKAHVCECYDTENKARPTVRSDNVCFVKKELQDPCLNDNECRVTIPGSVCLGLKSNKGICQCPGEFVWDNLKGECLQLVSINQTCRSQVQCNHGQALGDLGFCNEETKKCECRDQSRKAEAGYLEGKCYFRLGANETCKYREECVLGYGKNADCLQHPAYNDEKICSCPPGEKCAGTTAVISLSLIAAVGIVFIAKSMY